MEVPSLRVVGRVELGFGLDSVLTDPEGRLAALCPGYDAKNPAESLPRELVIVDLAAARERGRLPLEPGTDLSWQSRDGRMLALLQGLPRTAKYPFPASKVTLVDATGPSVTGTLDGEVTADTVYWADTSGIPYNITSSSGNLMVFYRAFDTLPETASDQIVWNDVLASAYTCGTLSMSLGTETDEYDRYRAWLYQYLSDSMAVTARDLGVPDHGSIVWDEVVAFLLVLYFVGSDDVRVAFAFLLFRLFDILKPPPIRQLDAALKNGFGVMADDILAAGYTLLVFALWQRTWAP